MSKKCPFGIGDRVEMTWWGTFRGLYPYPNGYVRKISSDGRMMALSLFPDGGDPDYRWVPAARRLFRLIGRAEKSLPVGCSTPRIGSRIATGRELAAWNRETGLLADRCGSIVEALDLVRSIRESLPKPVPCCDEPLVTEKESA